MPFYLDLVVLAGVSIVHILVLCFRCCLSQGLGSILVIRKPFEEVWFVQIYFAHLFFPSFSRQTVEPVEATEA